MGKVANEVALEEFERMSQAYDLDLDPDNEALKQLKDGIVECIEKGQVTIDEKGYPTVHLKYPVGEITKVTFKELTSEALVAVGDKKSTNTVTQDWKALADMTGAPFTLFQKMRLKPDFRICQKFILLFLV